MEGLRHRVAQSRVALAVVTAGVVLASAALAACASAPPGPETTPIPTLAIVASQASTTQTPDPTDPVASDIPESPVTTSATALARPQRGTGVPVGAVVFGTDVSTTAKAIGVVGMRTTFAAGRAVAWRVTLPAAIGGESVRVTLTTADNTETLVDEFVAQADWNVYYGKSLLTVAPGTYVLHYLVDGHEVGSGTFSIRAPDAVPPTPAAASAVTPPPNMGPSPST